MGHSLDSLLIREEEIYANDNGKKNLQKPDQIPTILVNIIVEVCVFFNLYIYIRRLTENNWVPPLPWNNVECPEYYLDVTPSTQTEMSQACSKFVKKL